MTASAGTPDRPRRDPLRPGPPRARRRTVRFRLTALYGILFVICGAALLAIIYTLVAARNKNPIIKGRCKTLRGPVPCPSLQARTIAAELDRNRAIWQHHLLETSVIALAIMVVVAIGLGWLMAGRVLRPLRRITDTAQNLSTENLHERIGLCGPDDELKHLADTFDGMLARLESAFDSQRRFIANASHELHTPLTVQRAAIEVALADPDPTVDSLQSMAVQLRAATERHEHIIDSLLALARGQRGVQQWDHLDLAAVAQEAIEAAMTPSASTRSIPHITADLAAAPLLGDRILLDQLAANLVNNAIRHNVPGGWITVRTATRGGAVELCVTNSGPAIPPDAAQSLFQPFHRLGPERTQTDAAPGAGLGLSIVAAIAQAHQGTATAAPLQPGGLEVTVTLPGRPGVRISPDS
jgi:signal transduction histidine kinase